MALDFPRSFGPGLRDAVGGTSLVEVASDRGVALLRSDDGDQPRAVLHQRPPDTAPLLDQADRLLWLAGRRPAPEVIAAGRADEGDEAVVIRLGPHAASAEYGHPMGPEALLNSLAEALSELHEQPIEQCPFVADPASLRPVAAARIESGAVSVADDGPYIGREPSELATIFDGLVAGLPDDDAPVFVHGALAPQRIWLDPSGEVTLLGWQWSGVGDRHLDLAAGAALLSQLHGPALVAPFIEAYGFDRVDLRRLDAYQLLAHLLS